MALCVSPSDFDISLCKSNYGQFMQTSSLADWVELQVLCGVSLPWKSLAETMREANIVGSLIDETYVDRDFVEEELGTNAAADVIGIYDESLPEGSAETVRRIIDYRMQYLGDSYPFVFDSLDRLRVANGFPLESSSYLDLLRLSMYMGWIYKLPGGASLKDTVTHMFEVIVDIALRSAGLSSSIMGTSRSGTFWDRLQNCGKELGLSVSTQGIKPSKNAKDDGVDVIAGFLWGDHRIGEPIWLIQATCGKNRQNRWKAKLQEPDPGKWADYLSNRSNPIVFLAVPYHMTEGAIDNLVPHYGSWSFIDRLRIVKMIGKSIDYGTGELADQGATMRAKAQEMLGIPA